MHLFAGLGADADEARLNGPITARGNVCACTQCTEGNFDSCEMKAVFGEVRRVEVPREKNQTSGIRQLTPLSCPSFSTKHTSPFSPSQNALIISINSHKLKLCSPWSKSFPLFNTYFIDKQT